MTQQPPAFGATLPDAARLAAAYGLPADARVPERTGTGGELRIRVLHAGAEDARGGGPGGARPAGDGGGVRGRQGDAAGSVHVQPGAGRRRRHGVHPDDRRHVEDPATGSASGPLGCYLVRHGIVPLDKAATIVSAQGVKMNRPSRIHIRIDADAPRSDHARARGRRQRAGRRGPAPGLVGPCRRRRAARRRSQAAGYTGVFRPPIAGSRRGFSQEARRVHDRRVDSRHPHLVARASPSSFAIRPPSAPCSAITCCGRLRGWQVGRSGDRAVRAAWRCRSAPAVAHYGQGIFEGFKAFPQPDGGAAMFRPDANHARMNRTCQRMAMPEIPASSSSSGTAALVRARSASGFRASTAAPSTSAP